MVTSTANYEVSVKVVFVGKIGYYLSERCLAVSIENVVYKLYV